MRDTVLGTSSRNRSRSDNLKPIPLSPVHQEIHQCSDARREVAILRIHHPDRWTLDLEASQYCFQVTSAYRWRSNEAGDLDQSRAGQGGFHQRLGVI